MKRQTWKEFKKTHKGATVEQWLESREDKRKATVPKHEYPKDRITKLYAGKDRGLVRKND